MGTSTWRGADRVALIGNYSVLSKHPGRDVGGGAIGLGMNRGDFRKSSPSRAVFTNAAWDKKSGVPDGYRPPYTWTLPLTAGGLSARNTISGAGAASIAMAGGVNGAATLAGSGDLTGTAALIVSLVAALSGSGTITSATAQAFLNLASSLAGSGDLAGSARALAHAAAALSASGTATATIRATGALASSITVTGDALTSANVASSVWGAIATNSNASGSMGEKLNDAGSAGNPWATVIEAGLTAEAFLRIIAAAVAGESAGSPGGPITFTGLDGSTIRISGTADADGNRSGVTVDGA